MIAFVLSIEFGPLVFLIYIIFALLIRGDLRSWSQTLATCSRLAQGSPVFDCSARRLLSLLACAPRVIITLCMNEMENEVIASKMNGVDLRVPSLQFGSCTYKDVTFKEL